jgi:hypothetical protein
MADYAFVEVLARTWKSTALMAVSHAWIAFPSDKFKAESHPDNITNSVPTLQRTICFH